MSGGPTVITTIGGIATATSSGHVTSDVVRAGLSYKLDWPGMGGGNYRSMPVKAPVAAIWSWSGFYIGGHAGYGWGDDPTNDLIQRFNVPTPPVFLAGEHPNGFVGGFQAGANWQDRSFVGGFEIDLSGTDLKSSASATDIAIFAGTPLSVTKAVKLDLLGSARARLGYLVSPDVLLYGTGGLAWTHYQQTISSFRDNPGDFIDLSPTATWRYGWVAGAGGEMRLWNSNWLARVEYLHYDFGNSGNAFNGFTTDGVPNFITSQRMSGHLTADVVRTGISYKLD
jgi:outer membrane immunogenic protein